MIGNEIKCAINDLQNSTETHSIDVVIMVNNSGSEPIIETELIDTNRSIRSLANCVKDIYSKIPKFDMVIFINIYKGKDNEIDHRTVVYKHHGTQMVIVSLLEAFKITGVYVTYYEVIESIILSKEQHQGPRELNGCEALPDEDDNIQYPKHNENVGYCGPRGRRGPKGCYNSDMSKWVIDNCEYGFAIEEVLNHMESHQVANVLVIKTSGYFTGDERAETKSFKICDYSGLRCFRNYIKDSCGTDIINICIEYLDTKTFRHKTTSRTIMSEDAVLYLRLHSDEVK